MSDTEEKTDPLVESLRERGLQEGRYIVSLTKEFKFERIIPSLSIEEVMPYPISEEVGLCPICNEDYKIHSHMDYFVKPKHVKAVRNFFFWLNEKLNTCRTLYVKLCTETPDTVLNPKDTILLLKDLAQQNPEFANEFIPLFAYYSPHETIKVEIQLGVERQLAETEIRYAQMCRRYLLELELHRRLLGFSLDQEKEALDELIKKHEHNAKIDYVTFQADLHRITSRILGYEKLFQKFTEEPRFGKIKRALKQQAERPIYFPPSYGLPIMRRRRQPIL